MFQVLPLAEVMVAKSEQLLQGLKSSKKEDRVAALKQVKNQIIGNKHKKQALKPLLPTVIHLLSSSSDDPDVAANSAVVLGSFSYGGTDSGTVQQILDHPQGLPSLLNALVHSEDARVLDAVVRCLKNMCQAGQVPSQPLLQPPVLPKLVQLLRSTESQEGRQPGTGTGLAEAAAAVLAKCCRTPEERVLLTEAGVVRAAAQLLGQIQHMSGQHQALQLLAALVTPASAAACDQLLQVPEALSLLCSQLRSSNSHASLLAATCIAHLSRATTYCQPVALEDSRVAGASGNGRLSRQSSGKGSAGFPARSGPSVSSVRASYTVEGPAVQSMLPIRSPIAVGPTGSTAAASVAPSEPGSWHKLDSPAGASRTTLKGVQISEEMSEKLLAAQKGALPVVLRLLMDNSVSMLATPTLAVLIEDSDELQQAAVDADATRQLCTLLNQQQPSAAGATEQQLLDMRQGCLRSLGFLCMERDDARKVVIDAKVLPHIHAALEESRSAAIRSAAALCVMALSRSVKTLRCSVLTPEIAQALCRLLGDEDIRVQVDATRALCNLVLEFSTVKDVLMESQVLDKLVLNAASQQPELRVNSTWALRNLVYRQGAGTKQSIMQALGWSRMRSLLNDSNEAVQEQALGFLRNLYMDDKDKDSAHVNAAFQWGGSDMLAALEEKLDPSRSVSAQQRIHALYTVVNCLTGPDNVKEQVMNSNLPALLLHYLRGAESAEMRSAATVAICNLLWVDTSSDNGNVSASEATHTPSDNNAQPQGSAGDGAAEGSTSASSSRGLESRIRRLRALGVQDMLQALLVDPSLDVRDRARMALSLMRSATTG